MHNTQECVASSQKMHPLSFGPKWRFKAKQAAANFSLPMHQYGCSFPFFQDGVSGVHKMTGYKDGGLLGEFFLTV
jgi:hypothetical protein